MQNSKYYLIGPTESVLTNRGTRFPDFANFLLEKGHLVVYYTSDFYHAEKRHFKREELISAKQKCKYLLYVIPVLGYSQNISTRRVVSNFWFSLGIFLKLLQKVRRNDCVIIPSRPVELIFFISLLGRIKRCRICLDIQDIWPDALQISNQQKRRLFTRYCDFFLKPSLKYYTSTFHVAPSFVYWLKRYAPKKSSTFLPLGWENDRWQNSLSYSASDDYVKLVCVAQLTYQFDIMPIVGFLKSNPKYKLKIIGEDGKGERYPEVINYINLHGIENVSFIGKVPHEEMPDALVGDDIGIVPMLTSSIPNKLFDYLGARLPIIVLGKNDSADFVHKYDIGWSCDYNTTSFSSLMEKITREDIGQKRMSIDIIRDSFSRNQLNKTFYKILTL